MADETVVDALCDHPQVRAISFVGSTPVAKHVYARAAASGKRMQCQGGAKNHVIVLPDADMELATQIISDSAFGCAGQRCLAVSVAVTIGEAQKTFGESIADAASKIRIGNGLDAGVQMGPVITQESKQRIESLIGQGVGEGAKAIVDGRNAKVPNHEGGNFLKPTVLDGLPASSSLAHTEIFGPVLSLVHANSIDDAMEFLAQQSLRQSGVAVYDQRRGGAEVSLRGAGGEYRDQYWSGGSDGVFPVQRMEGKLLWHFARARARCGGVLYRVEDRCGALVAAGNAEVLAAACDPSQRIHAV